MRPRILRLTSSEQKELEGEYNRVALIGGASAAYARRLRAILLNAEGRTSSEIAHELVVSRSKVSDWLRRYSQRRRCWQLQFNYYYDHGWTFAYRGRPRKLTLGQEEVLNRILRKRPDAYGVQGKRYWTAQMVGRVIEKEFGVHYHVAHVRKMLVRGKLGTILKWRLWTL